MIARGKSKLRAACATTDALLVHNSEYRQVSAEATEKGHGLLGGRAGVRNQGTESQRKITENGSKLSAVGQVFPKTKRIKIS